MYGYPYPPPDFEREVFEKGMKIAMKLRDREAKQKERGKEREKKEAEAARLRRLTSLEWFILGIVSYPIVGPMYNVAIHHLQNMVH